MEEILLIKLDKIFYKHYKTHSNVFFSGEGKYFKLQFYGYLNHIIEYKVDFINENIDKFQLATKKINKDSSDCKIMFRTKNEGRRVFFVEGKKNEYCEEISLKEYLKELI